MPFVQRVIEPRYLSRTTLFTEDGKPRVSEDELEAVTNNTLCNALRQLASLVLVAEDIFSELENQLQSINKRSELVNVKINLIEGKVTEIDPKKVTVPEGDITTFALLKNHYVAKHEFDKNLFAVDTRPTALKDLYEAATKTPVHLMRHLDRFRRDGHRTSRFFLCTPVLGAKRRKIRNQVDIDIETGIPSVMEDLRRWTSNEALGDITVTPDCVSRIMGLSVTGVDGDITDGTMYSDDEGIDHKLPSPEEQVQVVALKFPAQIVAVDISGRSFDRMSVQRRSLMHGDTSKGEVDPNSLKRRTRSRRPRSRRRNTLAGTDQKEIQDALAGETTTSTFNNETETKTKASVCRSKSSDLLRSTSKKESPENKKSHFNTLKQWGKNRYDKLMNRSSESKKDEANSSLEESPVKDDLAKIRTHERNSSFSSSEKSSINIPVSNPNSVLSANVKLREAAAQRRQRRAGSNKEEPHSSSGNWSASSESGRASIGSEITSTTHPKSTTSAATSSNSLYLQPPSSVNSRRRFVNHSTSSSVTSEGTLTPDIIHDLHEDGETSSIYSCDTEGYYTSFHMDSGLKTLKEEELPSTPIHSTTALSNNMSAENEYELFGKGSTSTTTSSAGTVCTTLRASESNRSLVIGPPVPDRKSSLSKSSKSAESSLERDFSDKTGTVKRSPAMTKPIVVALIHKHNESGDVSPDSGHNTSSSPIDSMASPSCVRSGSEYEFSESSDVEGAERVERIRVKTTINSSRIPSMCVITPPHSDDESENSSNSDHNYNKKISELNNINQKGSKNLDKNKLELSLKQHGDSNGNELKSTDSDKENCNMQTRIISTQINGTNKLSLINVNPQSGYATIETIDAIDNKPPVMSTFDVNKNKSVRAASPSGGTLTIKPSSPVKSPPLQPLIKASLMPLNNMFGKLKSNFVNLATRRDSKSPNRNADVVDYAMPDEGEYVTIADVRNNNEKSMPNLDEQLYANDVVNKNLKTVLSGKIRETEYISLNELPCNETRSPQADANDSLERKKRYGARVTLNAEGKVVFSSDSLKRRKGAHTTFEPGPFVKSDTLDNADHRQTTPVRPIQNSQSKLVASIPDTEFNRPLSPQLGKLVIKAASGMTSPSQEIVRMPPSTIVSPTNLPSKNIANRGAYVHIQDSGRPLSPTQEKGRVSPLTSPSVNCSAVSRPEDHPNMYRSREQIREDEMENQRYLVNPYYAPRENYGGSNMYSYSTLPNKKTQYLRHDIPERSVTPDIMRDLSSRNYSTNSLDRLAKYNRPQFEERIQTLPQPYLPNNNDQFLINQKLGIPVQMPVIGKFNHDMYNRQQIYGGDSSTPTRSYHHPMGPNFSPINPNLSASEHNLESFKISPIDPKNTGTGLKSSTPSSKGSHDLKSAINLDKKLLSPKKSTMTNEELYAIIHKSKKKMNIDSDDSNRSSPITTQCPSPVTVAKNTTKAPESGYIGDNKVKSRLSWSPSKGEYVDFNPDIDKISPPNDSRTRQSWACNDRKGNQLTSRLDFKKLLLQKSNVLSNKPAKLSAVEQLKLSKQKVANPKHSESEMSILELSGSPRSLVNRRFINHSPGSPKNVSEKPKPMPKILSPRSQWRFANPRTDVLSSTILEDCREDESPNNSTEKKNSSIEKNIKSTEKQSGPTERNLSQKFQDLKIEKSSPQNILLSNKERINAQRAQFFNLDNPANQVNVNPEHPPSLETAF